MKKILATALACVMSVSAFACLAACGDGKEKETADRDAPAYADGEWGAKLDLTELQKGDLGVISPDLFGLFLEDINYASFALDDNLIVNGSFETVASGTSKGKENGWTESGATIEVKSGTGALHTNNQNYAQVTVAAANGKIANSGHPQVPVAVKNGVEYKFSMFIKEYAGDVTVAVVDKQGTEYAKGTFTVTESADWTKYIKTVKANGTKDDNLTVEISFSAADTFYIDSVALETGDATDFGMKNYMYEAIADLGPKFFRFPGGCVIEGKSMESAYDWKNSIGATVSGTGDTVEGFTYPVNDNGTTSTVTTYGEQATRKQNVNIWQIGGNYYDHEYGIGFYEYFCLCEALGAKAVPIVNCGYSCETQTGAAGYGIALEGRHKNGVDDYIQDAIDLLEFAKGDASTKWGKIRSEMGHPEPFEMDYIGVGNEQWDSYYKNYYEKFLTNTNFKAALEKYNVRTIVGNCTMMTHCESYDANGVRIRKGLAQNAAEAAHRSDPTNFPDVASYGVVDQHYYVNYTDFFANTKMYDNYVRKMDDETYYYDVFVGEYAANTAKAVTTNGTYEYTQNDWISALSEAAMMTGFERNGDIIKLAAYAPMFAVADTGANAKQAGDNTSNQWNGANMMYFTNHDVLFTPSYFVQQLFMHNAGTQKVKSNLTFAGGSMPTTTIDKVGSGTFTYDNLYYVTSYNEETENIIVKIVNAGATKVNFNVNVDVGKGLTGIAQVNEISNADPHAVSTYANGNAITPKAEKIGFTGGSFGYEVKPYSVVAFQIRVK